MNDWRIEGKSQFCLCHEHIVLSVARTRTHAGVQAHGGGSPAHVPSAPDRLPAHMVSKTCVKCLLVMLVRCVIARRAAQRSPVCHVIHK